MVKTRNHVKQSKSDTEKQVSYVFSHVESRLKKQRHGSRKGTTWKEKEEKKKAEKK